MKKYLKPALLSVLLIAFTVIALTGCFPGNGSNGPADRAGFFSGVWHGWIAPVSLVLSVFKPSYSIYEVYNTGILYDLGFYAAVISGFGGLSLARNKIKKNR